MGLENSSNNTTFPLINSVQRASGGSSSGNLLKPASLGLTPPNRGPPRKKVTLQPGHSPLDWARLNQITPRHELRGVPPNAPPPQMIKVNRDEVKKHKVQNDCWTIINNKVFNITPYVNFHPGGVDEIMKCAGRDGTALFNKYHSWVNVDRMLENCFIGMLEK